MTATRTRARVRDTRNRPGERGDMAVEAAIGAPVFLLLIGVVIFGGRVAMTDQAVDAAAAEAARAASISRSAGQAHAQAQAQAGASLTNHGLECLTRSVVVDTSGFTAPVGTPATVTVTVTCQVDLGDLVVPGVPGSRTSTATVTSPLDTYRERG